jgi:hypothetical protein
MHILIIIKFRLFLNWFAQKIALVLSQIKEISQVFNELMFKTKDFLLLLFSLRDQKKSEKYIRIQFINNFKKSLVSIK